MTATRPRRRGPERTTARLGQLFAGLVAAGVLLALVIGVPYGLVRWVGWPLPGGWPTGRQISAALTGSVTDRFLLNVLACLLWLAWATFLIDVIRTLGDADRRSHRSAARPRHLRPLRGLASVLVTTIVTGALATLLSARAGHADRLAADQLPSQRQLDPSQLAVTGQRVDNARSAVTTIHPEYVVVEAPHNGIHDSLWRIAERYLGDGNRWPEIYRLNHGLPQPDGRTLQQPSVVLPGWVLRLPHTETTENHLSTAPQQPHQRPAPPRAAEPPNRSNGGTAPPTDATSPATSTTSAPLARTPNATGASTPPSTSEPTPPAAPTLSGTQPPRTSSNSGGVELGDGAYVGLGLASAIGAALLVARRRRRRHYIPGSGKRDDLLLPVAPAVRTLHLAHLRATATGEDPLDAADDDPAGDADMGGPHNVDDTAGLGVEVEVSAAPSNQAPIGTYPYAEQPDAAATPGLAVGTADGKQLTVDLAQMRGLGLVGPGAANAARALLVQLLGETSQKTTVLLPISTATLLQLPMAEALPRNARVVGNLTAALDTAETQLLRHARVTELPNNKDVRAERVVLFADVPADTSRLQAVLDAGAGGGIEGLLLGQWRSGASVYIATDGTVTATSPGPAQDLQGARLFQLPAPQAAKLLAVLREGEPSPTAHTGTEAEHADAVPTHGNRPSPTASETTVEQPPGARPPASARTQHPSPPPARLSRGTLHVSVLGPVRVLWSPPPAGTTSDTDPDESGAVSDVTGSLSPRLRELLVLLALHPEGISRDRIADALWPDTTTDRPFATANKTLTRLKQAIATATGGAVPAVVIGTAERYLLDPHLVHVDFTDFNRALATARTAREDIARGEAYRAMIAAYRGELAEGLTAEWIETPREATRRDAVDAAAGRARIVAADDPRGALDLLETARRFDPYNEALYRSIMKVQRRLGQTDAVTRTLQLLTTRLAEIHEAPDPVTLALAERLTQPATSPEQPCGVTSPPATATRRAQHVQHPAAAPASGRAAR